MKKDIPELKAKLDVLEDELAFINPKQLSNYIKSWTGGFHRYSLNNYILAQMQSKYDISILAGYQRWRQEGRQVMRGQKGLTILMPYPYSKENEKGEEEHHLYFKPGSVFDLSQTGVLLSGVPIKEKQVAVKGGLTIPYTYDDPNKADHIKLGGTQHADNKGHLTMDEIKEKSPMPVVMQSNTTISDGSTDFKVINIAERDKDASMVAAYFHELAHNFAGHKTRKISREVMEIEAEAIAYVAGSYFGIDNPDSVLYIKNWSGNRGELAGHGATVISVVEQIIDIFDEIEVKKDGKSRRSAIKHTKGTRQQNSGKKKVRSGLKQRGNEIGGTNRGGTGKGTVREETRSGTA
jgi:hypothetical protein